MNNDPEIKTPGGIIMPNPDYVEPGPAKMVSVAAERSDYPFGCKHDTDVVPDDVVRACVANCDRADCHLKARYRGGTLLGSPGNYYDRNGRLIAEDPNSTRFEVTCRACRRGWYVNRQSKRSDA